MVPKEAAIFLPFRLARSPLTMPDPSRAMTAMVASEPALVGLPLKLPSATRSMPRSTAPIMGTPTCTMSVSPACSALSASTPVA